MEIEEIIKTKTTLRENNETIQLEKTVKEMVAQQNHCLKRSQDQTLDDIFKQVPILHEGINNQRYFIESLKTNKRHQLSKFLTNRIVNSGVI